MSYNIGDKVICLHGYSSKSYSYNYGGAGYKDGKIFTIGDISNNVVWDGDFGIYTFAVKEYINRKSRIENLKI